MDYLILEQINICEGLVYLAHTPSMYFHAQQAKESLYGRVYDIPQFFHHVEHVLESISLIKKLIELSCIQLCMDPASYRIKRSLSIFNDMLNIYEPHTPHVNWVGIVLSAAGIIVACYICFELCVAGITYVEGVEESKGLTTLMNQEPDLGHTTQVDHIIDNSVVDEPVSEYHDNLDISRIEHHQDIHDTSAINFYEDPVFQDVDAGKINFQRDVDNAMIDRKIEFESHMYTNQFYKYLRLPEKNRLPFAKWLESQIHT